MFQLDWWSTSWPKSSNVIFATVAGKRTCGSSAGEMDNVHKGLFSVLYVAKIYKNLVLNNEKSMFFKSKVLKLMYYQHIL